MDDLASVEWTVPKATGGGQQRPQASSNYYPILHATPSINGAPVTSSLQLNQRPAKESPTHSISSTPANDSFANLVSFNGSHSSKGLSLQDRQRKLQEEKLSQEAEKRRAFDAQFGTTQTTPWSSVGDGGTTPDRIRSPPIYTATSEYGGQKLSKIINKPFAGIPVDNTASTDKSSKQEDDDLLAAFSASAPVNRSSHMPEESRSANFDPVSVYGKTMSVRSSSMSKRDSGPKAGYTEDEDDDPFGLGIGASVKSLANGTTTKDATTDDNDVLGMLSRPVSEFPKPPVSQSIAPSDDVETQSHPQERALAELFNMGFDSNKSRRALEATESGTDVQAAVGILLRQAHDDSRKQTQTRNRGDEQSDIARSPQSRRAPGRRKSSTSGVAKPAWMQQQGRSDASQTRKDSRSPVNGEKDSAQYASELGNKMFKTAGSLWKTGTKKFNQAVQELNSDSDSNQPKWMREAQPGRDVQKPKSQSRKSEFRDHNTKESHSDGHPSASAMKTSVTDEALMLEADSRPPPRKPRAQVEPIVEGPDQQRPHLPLPASKDSEEVLPQPKLIPKSTDRAPKAKLSRQAVEAEISQAYISPARRKRPISKPLAADVDATLISESSTPPSHHTSSYSLSLSQSRATTPVSLPASSRPPDRTVPLLSSFALQASTKGRQEGNSAFKRGDYAQALSHYSTSLSIIPSSHPIAIVLLTNRALSNSKIGDPKASIADARSALDLIGSSRGIGETVDLGGDEGTKQMSTYWEKAMMRQAEGLEHMERWSEAAATWRICVEAGAGGAVSIAGRNRCEKAATPQSHTEPSALKRSIPRPRPKVTATSDLAPDSESVTRLRAANAAADRLDDERFALADVVEQRISRWRAGKEGNLRALLSTLENVLWEGSGWKKVGMGDVLLPAKVKVVYMKAIAKVHPDKVNSPFIEGNLFC